MPTDTELHKAAHNGDLGKVKQLVEDGEIAVNEPGAAERRALHRWEHVDYCVEGSAAPSVTTRLYYRLNVYLYCIANSKLHRLKSTRRNADRTTTTAFDEKHRCRV